MNGVIKIARLTSATVFKLVGIGLFFSLVPLSLLTGVMSFFGKTTVSWFGRPLTGLAGLAAAPVIGIFSALVSTTVLGGAIFFGLWLFSKARPLEITFKVDSEEEAPATAASVKQGLLKGRAPANSSSEAVTL